MTIKISDLKKKIKSRKADSYKTKNGRVLVVGGSNDYHGAPIFCGLAAVNTGVDLVKMAVPESNFEVTRNASPALIVKKYPGEYLSSRGRELIYMIAKKADVAVIGPGLKDRPETIKAVKDILLGIDIPVVLDAEAIQALELVENMPLSQKLIITPHHGEFEKLIGKAFKIRDPQPHKSRLIRTLANDLKMNILLKGPVDLIASDDGKIADNTSGNAGMTKGGTGDVLAGMVGGLIAQGVEMYDAGCLGAYCLGKAGEKLYKEKGYAYTTMDLIEEIPYQLKSVLN
ncbi:NAD(P)H-hydrate dehydratase [Candidatus Peregrinibacteria bacterium]|nr:NAD(P)H-hydrate dehydratase [Candidatus Peregrinibacteria bacterium]